MGHREKFLFSTKPLVASSFLAQHSSHETRQWQSICSNHQYKPKNLGFFSSCSSILPSFRLLRKSRRSTKVKSEYHRRRVLFTESERNTSMALIPVASSLRSSTSILFAIFVLRLLRRIVLRLRQCRFRGSFMFLL